MAEPVVRAAPRYDEATARRWLTWLAREMQQRGVTVFLIEDLQPACLARWTHYVAYVVVSRFVAVLAVIAPLLAVAWAQAWTVETVAVLRAHAAALWAFLVVVCLGDARWPATSPAQRVIRLVVVTLLTGAAAGLFGWYDGTTSLDELGLFAGVYAVLGAVMAGARPRRPVLDIRVIESLTWSWRRGLLGLATGVALIATAIITTWEQRGDKFDFSDLVISAAFLAAVLLTLQGIKPGLPGLKASPNQGIRATARHALRVGIGVFLVAAVPFFVLDEATTGVRWLDPFPITGRSDFIGATTFLVAMAMLVTGGKEVIRHACLRVILWMTGALPLRLSRFLDHAAVQLQILQKVGGGYIFVHRLLLEHFAGAASPRSRFVLGAATSLLVSLLWAGPQAAWPGGGAMMPPLRAGAPDAAVLADGDLIFRSGTSLESRLIRMADRGSRYSHVGLVERRDGAVSVVHIEPAADGGAGAVRREPLGEYLAAGKANGFAVYRSDAGADRAAAAVTAALGYQAAGVTFDHGFDLDTPAAMYCSELVWRAWLAAGIDLTQGRLEGVYPLGPRRAVRLSTLERGPGLALVVEGRPR